MPKTVPLQSSFASGEISPALYGRIDTDAYKQGLKTCRNMIPNTRGPVLNRPGSEHRRNWDESNGVVQEYVVNKETVYICSFTDSNVNIRSMGGEDVHELITNGSFLGSLSGWTVDDSDVPSYVYWVNNNTCFMRAMYLSTSHNPPVARLSQIVDVAVSGTYELILTGELRSRGGETVVTVTHVATDIELIRYVIPINAIYSRTNIPIGAAGVGEVRIDITVHTDPAAGESGFAILDTVGLKIDAIPAIDADYPTMYRSEDLQSLQFEINPSAEVMYITSEHYWPHKITYDTTTKTFGFEIVAFTYDGTPPSHPPTVPPEWITSPPTTMTFFQNRTWWSGCKDHPALIWASASKVNPGIGDYEHLGSGSGTDATDPILLSMSKHGRVMWMYGAKKLLVGTELHEFSIWSGSSSDSTIAPNRVTDVQETSYGSVGIKPAFINNSVVFVPSDARKLRTLWYQWTQEGYVSQNVSYIADHLFTAKVIDVATVSTPMQMIACVLDDGGLLLCTYHQDGGQEAPLLGWSKHNFDGIIKSIATVGTPDHAEIWMMIERVIDGEASINLEVMKFGVTSSFIKGSALEYIFVDSHKSIVNNPASVDVPGLDHLIGKTVQPIVDGAVQPTKVVAVDGSIELDRPGQVITVGLPIRAELSTLPMIVEDRMSTTFGFMKRWTKIYLYVFDSVKPEINGSTPPERFPASLMDKTQPSRSEIIEVSNLGHDQLAGVDIVHTLPRRFELLALFGEYSQESV